jgi:transducin (beta)-like 1
LIRIYDVDASSLLFTLDFHAQNVYSLAFSPNGRFLASGSFDGRLCLWNPETGQVITHYSGQGGIFETEFSKDNTRLAACYSTNQVIVADVTKYA